MGAMGDGKLCARADWPSRLNRPRSLYTTVSSEPIRTTPSVQLEVAARSKWRPGCVPCPWGAILAGAGPSIQAAGNGPHGSLESTVAPSLDDRPRRRLGPSPTAQTLSQEAV